MTDIAAAEVLWEWENRDFSQRRGVPLVVRRAYRDLAAEDARVLAVRAVEQLEGTPAGGRENEAARERTIEMVVRLACFVPGVLGGMCTRLVEQGMQYQFMTAFGSDTGVLFYKGEASARDRLFELADASRESLDSRDLSVLLSALAWVADDEVLAAFSRWAALPPAWTPASASERSSEWFRWFPTAAGWEARHDGTRRMLYPGGCRALIERGDTDAASVGGIDMEHCQWCGGPLTVLFDLNLSDDRLSFFGLSGDRLRVPTCEFCVCYGAIYIDADLLGAASWSHTNVRPPQLPSADSPDRLLAGKRGLGDEARSVLEPVAFGFGWDVEASHLGGVPTWIQDATYPMCGRCGELMPFLGQLDTAKAAWGEGMIYAFYDQGCKLAATLYQQT